jgi:hypothetical protein
MSKTMTARFSGKCNCCGTAFAAGASISYNGRATLTSCLAQAAYVAKTASAQALLVKADAHIARQNAALAEQATAAHAEMDHQAAHAKALAAGELATIEITADDIIVRRAPSFEYAKDLAFALIENATVATGLRHTIRTSLRGGKRYVGRELRTSRFTNTVTHPEGWAFPFKVT